MKPVDLVDEWRTMHPGRWGTDLDELVLQFLARIDRAEKEAEHWWSAWRDTITGSEILHTELTRLRTALEERLDPCYCCRSASCQDGCRCHDLGGDP